MTENLLSDIRCFNFTPPMIPTSGWPADAMGAPGLTKADKVRRLHSCPSWQGGTGKCSAARPSACLPAARLHARPPSGSLAMIQGGKSIFIWIHMYMHICIYVHLYMACLIKFVLI